MKKVNSNGKPLARPSVTKLVRKVEDLERQVSIFNVEATGLRTVVVEMKDDHERAMTDLSDFTKPAIVDNFSAKLRDMDRRITSIEFALRGVVNRFK